MDTASSIRERARVALAAGKGPTEEAVTQQSILSMLDALGGMVSGEDTIRYEGEGFTFPKRMEGNLPGVLRHLTEVMRAEETKIDFMHTFHFRPFDVAVAFSRVLSRLFGGQGIGLVTRTMFGDIPPQIHRVETGIGTYAEAPWGKIGFSALDAVFTVGRTTHAEYGICGHISGSAPRKHSKRIEGLWTAIEAELANSSIYRGKPITGAETPGFFNPFAITPDKVFYTAEVMRHLQANVWTVIEQAQKLRDNNVSLKRAILLEGPYGSGKSLAAMLTAQRAADNGWTAILVRGDDDPYEALRTARMYGPAVVIIEDLDILAAGKTREEMSQLLDLMDSVGNKNQEVMVIFTTNFLGDIDRGALRPGRIDSVIRIAYLDEGGYASLVKSVIPPARLAAEINYANIAEAFKEFLPAFASETARKALLYSMARGDEQVTEGDLLAAAALMQDQRELMDRAHEAKRDAPTLDETLIATVARVLRATRLAPDYEPFVVDEHV